MKPKQSLFKQKIKQTRAQKQTNNQTTSFPVAQNMQFTLSDPNIIKQKLKNQSNILQTISSVVSKDEFSKIQSQNEQFISKMSKQEIQNYKKMIMSQTPSKLLERLSTFEEPVTQTNPELPNEIPSNQIIQQHRNQEQKMQQKKTNEGNMEYLSQILIDITTSSLYMIQKKFTNNFKSNQNLVSIQQVKTMIESENNQTQVIGSQILTKLLLNFPKQKIINVNGHILHHSILIQEITKNIMPSLLFKIRTNQFISCWIQFMNNLCKIIQSKYPELPQSIQKMCLKTIQSQMHTKRQINIQTQQLIKQTFNFMVSKQQEIKDQLTLDSLKQQNMEELIQLIILQEAEVSQYSFKRTLLKLNELLQKLSNKPMTVLRVLYNIVSLFKIICNQRQKDLLSGILGRLRTCFQKILSEQMINKQSQMELFMYLICLKEINPQKFVVYVQKCNKDNNLNQSNIGILVFLNIKHYSEGQINQIQINNLKQMIKFLNVIVKEKQLRLETILSDLLHLYDSESSPYNEIVQMQPLIKYLVENCSSQSLKSIIPIQRMRHLCQKYNFSSYGNATFTKLLLYLAVINSQFEGILVEQVINRYPFLFYYVVQQNGVYSNIQLYKFNHKYTAQKRQIYEMILKTPDCNKNNIFAKYLTDK